PAADQAAECAYRRADAAIEADPTRRHLAAHEARLHDVVVRYESRTWSVEALARQGSLHDAETAAKLYREAFAVAQRMKVMPPRLTLALHFGLTAVPEPSGLAPSLPVLP